MIIAEGRYHQAALIDQLVLAFCEQWGGRGQTPLFLCIGSDRHILDCFGPLAGTMIKEKTSGADVYGTLAEPLHARNLVSQLEIIRTLHPGRIEVAMDASLGGEEEFGVIRFRNGPLLPGKALSKRLPAIGDYSITGIVGTGADKYHLRSNSGSLRPVYDMARAVSQAVSVWYRMVADH